VKFRIENIVCFSLIFTKQTITKFTINELMQKFSSQNFAYR